MTVETLATEHGPDVQLEAGQIWVERSSGRRLHITRIDADFEARWHACDPGDGYPFAGVVFVAMLRERFDLEPADAVPREPREQCRGGLLIGCSAR